MANYANVVEFLVDDLLAENTLCKGIEVETVCAGITFTTHCVAILSQRDDFIAFDAACGFEFRRVLQFFKVVLVCPVVDIHFRLLTFFTFFAILPIASMIFLVVLAAKGVAVMIAGAAIMGIREHDILIVIIANPLVAAERFCQFSCFAA